MKMEEQIRSLTSFMALVVEMVSTINDLLVVRHIKDHTVAIWDLSRKEREIPLIDLGTHQGSECGSINHWVDKCPDRI